MNQGNRKWKKIKKRENQALGRGRHAQQAEFFSFLSTGNHSWRSGRRRNLSSAHPQEQHRSISEDITET